MKPLTVPMQELLILMDNDPEHYAIGFHRGQLRLVRAALYSRELVDFVDVVGPKFSGRKWYVTDLGKQTVKELTTELE
jgi:hypothetical protein